MAIKITLNKLDIASDFSKIFDNINDNDIGVLPITFPHLQCLMTMPFHHRDPFDRIIIAQALTENLTIATKDQVFDRYGVMKLWN